MEEKKLYEDPVIEILDFEVSNIISESDGTTPDGGDGEGGDP